jgi:peptidoglycan/LPS O-acetylase OafA/YrhL
MAMFQHITGEWVNLFAHLVMLHNLFPATVVSFDGPFWSLALESQLYVIFPALVFFFSRYGAQRTALVSGVLSMLWQIGCRVHYGNHFTEFPTIGSVWYALPARFFEFVCGMWAAEVVTMHYRDNKTNHRAGLIALALLPLAILSSIPAEEICIPGRFIVWGAMFACIVVVVTTTSSTAFWDAGVMKYFTIIGVFSYSLYLVHFPIIGFVNSKLLSHHVGVLALTVVRIATVVASIGIAYGFHLAFERPFMNARPKLARVRRTTAASAVAE